MTGYAGCSYFGVRIPRHVRRHMTELAARGYTGVLHTFSENDLAYYRETMRELVEVSHEAGLVVQASPWGLGRTFGGEAESRFVAFHPEECEVLDDGRRVAAACLNSPLYRAFCREWADWALDCGVDSVFWDEPAWVHPAHVGVDDPGRWSCRCGYCAARFGAELPADLTPEMLAFREASVVDFLREMVGHVAARGGRSTICLLPATDGPHGISDWSAAASLPGLTTFATDPYWKHWGEAAESFVRRFARLLRETCDRHGVRAQLWLPSFGLDAADLPELIAAVAAARAEGIDDLWTWGYEACGHMSHLATPDAPAVWEAISAALTGRVQSPTEAAANPSLERQATRELVGFLSEQDTEVAAAVAAAGNELAAAIDAVADRLAAGGRLIYVGAGTSGALAALDAAECGPTFGTTDEVVAITAGHGEKEDDVVLAGRRLRELGIGPGDAVVAVSASGSTPFVVAGLEAARASGALCVAVVCARETALARLADHAVTVVVGPELIAGSTRLKAGTAQKLVLNAISTIAMVRLGRTYRGLMVAAVAHNEKLRERACRTVALATGAADADVAAALAAAGGDARIALVALLAGIAPDAARARLEQARGSVEFALEGLQ